MLRVLEGENLVKGTTRDENVRENLSKNEQLCQMLLVGEAKLRPNWFRGAAGTKACLPEWDLERTGRGNLKTASSHHFWG